MKQKIKVENIQALDPNKIYLMQIAKDADTIENRNIIHKASEKYGIKLLCISEDLKLINPPEDWLSMAIISTFVEDHEVNGPISQRIKCYRTFT